MQSKLIKPVVLVCFLILISGFIAFKAGTFDMYLASESITQNQDTTKRKNTTAKKNDTAFRQSPDMLSTSKSVIILDQKMKLPVKDTTFFKQKPKNK